MQFKSKAENLNQIKKMKINGLLIPNFFSFSMKDFNINTNILLKRVSDLFVKKVAIRSSSFGEDGKRSSHAGEFKSYLNIDPKNKEKVRDAILNVYESYKIKNLSQKILVQEMVEDVKISGVALSCDLTNYCESYIVCNYSISKNTTIVTSGNGKIKSFRYFKGSSLTKVPKLSRIIIKKINKLSEKTKEKLIDIEFAIDSKDKFFLLQCRPVIFNKQKKINSINPEYLKKLEKKIIKLQKPHPNLLGNTTFFGVMPDWNPAEMIGIKPKNMSKSLYKELITDKIWATQRSDYGFKDVMNNQLMSIFLGTPYIDVRTDFNSWIPKKLSHNTANKLLKYYLKKLKLKRDLHDSVEFNILFTCFNFNSKKIKDNLRKNNFQNKEINDVIKSLKDITSQSIKNFDKEMYKIKNLQSKQNIIEQSKMYEIDKIYWHIEFCKEFGTLPFAGLARIAFVAYDILNSLCEEGFINENQKILFLQKLETISQKIDKDFNTLPKKDFLKKHGHLRPNTYEITSLNYREGYKEYYGSKKKIKKYKNRNTNINFSKKQLMTIDHYLKKNGFNLNSLSLLEFMKKAIEAREYSKYIFTKSIDLIFHNILKIGKRLNIKRADLSYLEINDLLKLHFTLGSEDISKKFKNIIRKNKKEYGLNNYVCLPNIIIEPHNIYYNSENSNQGSFFGTNLINGNIFFLNENLSLSKQIKNLNNKIICIYNADPGFDFIFSKNILGLITCYGGSNSHMAIRCSEMNISSMIGVGQNNFGKIVNSKKIIIDPLAKKFSLL